MRKSLACNIWLCVCLLALFACGGPSHTYPPNLTQDSITIYGDPDCGHCEALVEALEDEGLPFTFKDVNDKEKGYGPEVSKKLRESHYIGDIELPVVVLQDTFLIRPTFEQVVGGL